MNKSCVLEASNLTFSHKSNKHVFSDVNFTLNENQIIAILGENGVGKSTFLDCISGLVTPSSGDILLYNKNINSYTKKELSTFVAYLSQQFSHTYNYLVKDYVLFGIVPRLTSILSKPKCHHYDKVFDVLKKFNMESFMNKPYLNLSGGERQLINIAKTLLQEPKIILFDEPTSALDYKNTVAVIKIIKELKEQNISIIFTTHNPEHVLLLECDVAIFDKKGIEQGSIDLINSNNLSRLYNTHFEVFYSDILARKCSGIFRLF